MYYTYILKSNKDDKHYIGWTDDLRHRLSMHNDGKVQSTTFRKPFKLIYYEACLDKNRAIAREKFFKTGYGRRFLKSRL